MTPAQVLGIGILLFVFGGAFKARRRGDGPRMWLYRAQPKTSRTYLPNEPTYYLRDWNPPSLSEPAAKGFKPGPSRATEHHATVVAILEHRRTH